MDGIIRYYEPLTLDGLSNFPSSPDSLHVAGDNQMLADANIGGHKLINVANGVLPTDAATIGQLPVIPTIPVCLKVDGTNSMAANANIGGFKVVNMANGLLPTDGATVGQLPVIPTIPVCLKVDGTNAMTADADMGSHKVINVSNAVLSTDATNLGQVQSLISAIPTYTNPLLYQFRAMDEPTFTTQSSLLTAVAETLDRSLNVTYSTFNASTLYTYSVYLRAGMTISYVSVLGLPIGATSNLQFGWFDTTGNAMYNSTAAPPNILQIKTKNATLPTSPASANWFRFKFQTLGGLALPFIVPTNGLYIIAMCVSAAGNASLGCVNNAPGGNMYTTTDISRVAGNVSGVLTIPNFNLPSTGYNLEAKLVNLVFD